MQPPTLGEFQVDCHRCVVEVHVELDQVRGSYCTGLSGFLEVTAPANWALVLRSIPTGSSRRCFLGAFRFYLLIIGCTSRLASCVPLL
jgi:hypothetical protein